MVQWLARSSPTQETKVRVRPGAWSRTAGEVHEVPEEEHCAAIGKHQSAQRSTTGFMRWQFGHHQSRSKQYVLEYARNDCTKCASICTVLQVCIDGALNPVRAKRFCMHRHGHIFLYIPHEYFISYVANASHKILLRLYQLNG